MTVWRSIGRIALVSFSLALAGYLVWAAQRGATTPAAEPAPMTVPTVAAPAANAAPTVTDPAFLSTSKSLAPDAVEALPAPATADPTFLHSSKSLGWNHVATPPPSTLPAGTGPVFLPSSKFGPLDPVPGPAVTVPAEPAPVFLPSSKSRAPSGLLPTEIPKEPAPPKSAAPGGKP